MTATETTKWRPPNSSSLSFATQEKDGLALLVGRHRITGSGLPQRLYVTRLSTLFLSETWTSITHLRSTRDKMGRRKVSLVREFYGPTSIALTLLGQYYLRQLTSRRAMDIIFTGF